jgi:hypothetical protein
MDYNVEAEIKDIIVTAGNTINISQDQYMNDDGSHDPVNLYDMSGMQLDIHVEDVLGNAVKDWSSAGGSPAITISTHSYNVYDLTALTAVAKYKYDVLLTNGSEKWTIRRGDFIVQKNIT